MSKAEVTQISLRLSSDVYEMLKAKTAETGLSLNSEVIQAIIEHCAPDGLASRLAKLEKDVAELRQTK